MGSSGGGSSGKVDYPDHMKVTHRDWMDKNNAIQITKSMTAVMNSAIGSSPFTLANAYDPSGELTQIITAANSLQTVVSALLTSAPVATTVGKLNTSEDSLQALATAFIARLPIATIINDIYAVNADFNPALDNVLTGTYVDDVINKYAAGVWARVNETSLPQFNAGMRDINAVVASSFIVGRGIIEAEATRDINSFGAQLYLKSASDDALKMTMAKIEYGKMVSNNLTKLLDGNLKFQLVATEAAINSNLAKLSQAIAGQQNASTLTGEANRIKMIALGEQSEKNLAIDEADALWDLGVFQHGANLLASIGGGTAVTSSKGTSKAASALGGGMMGAASGAYVGAQIGSAGGPIGAAGGAVIGGVIGVAAGLLA